MAPGWLSQLSVQLLVSAQAMVSGSWDWAPCWAPCPAQSAQDSFPSFPLCPFLCLLSLSKKKLINTILEKSLWTVKGYISKKDKIQQWWWYCGWKWKGPWSAHKEGEFYVLSSSPKPYVFFFFFFFVKVSNSHIVRQTLGIPRTVTFQSDCRKAWLLHWSLFLREPLYLAHRDSHVWEAGILFTMVTGNAWYLILMRRQEQIVSNAH